jgi:TctA family transporter
MEHDQDFSALRNLLASTRLDMPQDTQVDQFLTEFHNRQRAQLLARQSLWSRATDWMQEKVFGISFLPSLSYGSAFAAVAIVAFVGLSQNVVQVTQVDGQSRLSFRMPTENSSFAMVPGSLMSVPSISAKSDSPVFTPTRGDSATTRYVLANTSQKAYDATVAF